MCLAAMEYDEAIDIVSGLFRIKQWANNEYGERYAILDNDIEIRVFQSASDTMVLQGMFGDSIPNPSVANSNEAKLSYVLQSNFIRIIHHDDVLSIDKRTARLVTTRYIGLLRASMESIMDLAEGFIQNIDFWDMVFKRKQSFSSMSPLLNLFRKR
jgi:hypothetical protein